MSSEPKIVHANAFAVRFAVVLAGLTFANMAVAYLFRAGPLAPLLSFLLTLAAAWLLVHLLFDRIDGLVTDRLADPEN